MFASGLATTETALPGPLVEETATHLDHLEREICELAGHLAAGTCRWLLLIAEFDRLRGWAQWGAKSCAHWLGWRCSIGRGAAREHVRVARRLPELPLVRAAFAAGELSYCKVRAISRVATPETEEKLVELGRHATGGQLEKLVRAYRGALEATIEHAEDVHERRRLNLSWEDDGSLRLEGKLSPDEGAVVLAALEAAEARPRPATGDPPESTGEMRRADALVDLARSALAAGDSVRANGDPVEMIVHVDAGTLAGDCVGERSELADGPVLAPETVRRLGCDASVARIIERDGRPLSVGRRRRTVPPSLRRALRTRDGGCRFPGCGHCKFLHAHHIQHWARGGPTSLDNLVQLCSHHHRLVHEGGFCVEHAGKHGIRFRAPDGRLIAPAPAADSLSGPGLPSQQRGLAIDADTCKPRSLGDRLDYGIAVEGLLARELAGA